MSDTSRCRLFSSFRESGCKSTLRVLIRLFQFNLLSSSSMSDMPTLYLSEEEDTHEKEQHTIDPLAWFATPMLVSLLRLSKDPSSQISIFHPSDSTVSLLPSVTMRLSCTSSPPSAIEMHISDSRTTVGPLGTEGLHGSLDPTSVPELEQLQHHDSISAGRPRPYGLGASYHTFIRD